MSTKFYAKVNLSEHIEIFYAKVLRINNQEYPIPEEIVEEICKQSGISNTLRKILKNDLDLLIENIIAGCKYYYEDSVIFLVDEDKVVNISFNKYIPVSSEEFSYTICSFFEDYEDFLEVRSVEEEYDTFQAFATVYPKEGFTYQGNTYNLGVVFENSEVDTISCKLVVMKDSLEFYLPTRYYNLSAARYMRTSANTIEALRQLLLKVVESMTDCDRWFSIIPEVDMKLRNCEKIRTTYEEYKSVLRLLNRISVVSEMDDEEYQDSKTLLDDFFLEEFIQNYPAIEEKKGSYIWRCSAIGESTIKDLVVYMNNLRLSSKFYPMCQRDIMSTVGDFVMLDRISLNLAQRRK